nr:rna exonuclease 3 [Quercus suber]
MVFTTTNLFSGILCPGIQSSGNCSLTHCIFSHEQLLTPAAVTTIAATTNSVVDADVNPAGQPPPKRRKTGSNTDFLQQSITTSRAKPVFESSPNAVTPPLLFKGKGKDPDAPKTLKRPVSPPTLHFKLRPGAAWNPDREAQIPSVKPSSTTSSNTISHAISKQESLNPRLLANDPVGHAKRTLFLKHLHAAMVSLNQRVVHAVGSKDEDGTVLEQSLVLSDPELITLALVEEEKTAKEQGLVYANVIKNRIAAYKKMDLKAWLKQRRDSFMPVKQISPKANRLVEKVVVTGLTPSEECKVLELLIVEDQTSLSAYGYIASPPPESEAQEAAIAVEKSWNYELCERCTARFQVFPSRNQEGHLTGQGKCTYHPRRKINPQRTKADTGVKEPFYPCCNEPTGSKGCSESDHHVFKASTPARLAAVLPFVTTPHNPTPAKEKSGNVVSAVAFDCEMGYTTLGLELIRLTALSWPQGDTLIDVLVRPLGIVLDLNSQFSGVFPEHFVNAIPYNTWVKSAAAVSSPPGSPLLPVVESPQAARALLCSFLQPDTPLIGHAIENDLNAVRLCHPSIVDTILLFPHPRGLPMRLGLRALADKHLGRAIQQSSKHGHDSSEDAKATADLVRVTVRNRWKEISAKGWRFASGELVPPSPSSARPSFGNHLDSRKRTRDESSTDDESRGRGTKAFQ